MDCKMFLLEIAFNHVNQAKEDGDLLVQKKWEKRALSLIEEIQADVAKTGGETCSE